MGGNEATKPKEIKRKKRRRRREKNKQTETRKQKFLAVGRTSESSPNGEKVMKYSH